MPQFTIINKKTGHKKVVSLESDSIIIGRLAKNEITLESQAVSRKHAEIVRIKNDYFVVDLESGNGTLLNGKKIRPHEKTLIRPNDVIRIEEHEILPQFSPQELAGEEELTDSGIIEIKMIKKVLSALDTDQLPSIEGISPETKGRKVFFTDDLQEIVIGRDRKCTYPIDSNVVSRRHVVLHKKWGGVTITDLKSKNETFVNDRKVDETLLKDGDIIMLGTIKLLYRNPQEIDLEALSKGYKDDPFKDTAEILNGIEASKNKAEKKKEETKNISPQISEQAKLSLDEEKGRKDKEPISSPKQTSKPAPPKSEKKSNPIEKKETSKPPATITPHKPQSQATPITPPKFSGFEKLFMVGGIFIFIIAIILLVMILK